MYNSSISYNFTIFSNYSIYSFIEKEKKQKLTILKKVLGEEVYEKLLQLSNNYGKEIEATMIDLVELNCQPEAKQEEVIDDQWK